MGAADSKVSYQLSATADEEVVPDEETQFRTAVTDITNMDEVRPYTWISRENVRVGIEEELKVLSAAFPRFKLSLHGEESGEIWDSFFVAGTEKTIEGNTWRK